MRPILQNAVLGSDLDCANLQLLNLGGFQPVPAELVSSKDPMLSDAREVLDASVVNDSISAVAQIDQSKLNLNGSMPAAWLTPVPISAADYQAAQGSAAQPLSAKGAANGYAALDSNGLIPSAQVPHGATAGSVTSVGLTMPGRTFNVTGSPVTSVGTLAVSWVDAPNNSYLAAAPIPGGTLRPQFITTPFRQAFIPDFDASKLTTGELGRPRLQLALYGATHRRGMAPDPGQFTHPMSYLARSIHYHDFSQGIPRRPDLPPPQISVIFEKGDKGFTVVVRSAVKDSVLFYRVNDDPFKEAIQSNDDNNSDVFGFSSITLTLQFGDFVEAYAAKQGYNNSGMSSYEVTPPPDPIE